MVSSSVESLSCRGSGFCDLLELFASFAQVVLLSVLIMCAAVSEEAAASDTLVGAQPRIRCWDRARSSSSELVDTATARQRRRVEDATRVGVQFPFRPERRGRGAPSAAMTSRGEGGHHAWAFATRCHSRRSVLLATWNAIVATGGLHGASAAEAQTRHVC